MTYKTQKHATNGFLTHIFHIARQKRRAAWARVLPVSAVLAYAKTL